MDSENTRYSMASEWNRDYVTEEVEKERDEEGDDHDDDDDGDTKGVG